MVMKQYMESLVELIKPGLAQEVILGDIQMARNRTIELFECPLGEVATAWAAETPDNINLGRFQRSIPLLVLLWRLRHGVNDGHHGLNSGLWVSGALHGITKEVDHPEVVEFWNHIISLPNAKEHATPLAGASVETGGEG